ncbi:hypothetical protein GC174_11690 [bacterium]|nr:hypothetical protein [bacterium]
MTWSRSLSDLKREKRSLASRALDRGSAQLQSSDRKTNWVRLPRRPAPMRLPQDRQRSIEMFSTSVAENKEEEEEEDRSLH